MRQNGYPMSEDTMPVLNRRKLITVASRDGLSSGQAAVSHSLPAALVSVAPDGQTSPEHKVELSIVIPLLNEAENLEGLYARLRLLLNTLDRTAEVILVDDGSTDGSETILRELQANDARFHVIRLRRNFGQSAAFSAGFDFACGDTIVTMDGDLQNDPADIPLLLTKIDEGYDIVSGWRVDRQDSFLMRKLPSRIANWLISKVTRVELHDYGCSLKAYRREVLELTKLYGEMHRFIPALASWMGVTLAEVPVRHYARRYGRSKYGLNRVIRVILDLLTVKFLLDYATRPIQIFGLLGLASLSAGVATGLYLSYLKLIQNQAIGDRPLLFLVVLLSVVGVQLIIMGLLGEVIMRTYHEAQGKPVYIVRERIGSRQPNEAGSDEGTPA
jgi:glycosyltransferase involved in cell wall biosynthesis